MQELRPTGSPAAVPGRLWSVLIALLGLPGLASGQSIAAWLELSTLIPAPEELVEVEAVLDVRTRTAELGAYEAHLKWNPEELELIDVADGATPELASPQTHQVRGKLLFSNFQVHGVTGRLSLIRARFAVGAGGSMQRAGLELAFPILAASHSFANLLPEFWVAPTRVAAVEAHSWGAIKLSHRG